MASKTGQDRTSATRAAKAVGVESTALKQAKKVAESDPALFEQVKSGVIAVDKAYNAKLIKLKKQFSVSDLTPICWCAPLPCHAEVIKSCIEWRLTSDKQKWLERLDKPPVLYP